MALQWFNIYTSKIVFEYLGCRQTQPRITGTQVQYHAEMVKIKDWYYYIYTQPDRGCLVLCDSEGVPLQYSVSRQNLLELNGIPFIDNNSVREPQSLDMLTLILLW